MPDTYVYNPTEEQMKEEETETQMGKDISLAFEDDEDDDQIVSIDHKNSNVAHPSYTIIPDRMMNNVTVDNHQYNYDSIMSSISGFENDYNDLQTISRE